MRKWVENFFANKYTEIELNTNSVRSVVKILKESGWQHVDECWAPDLQIDLFSYEEQQLHLIQETFFNLQISGTTEVTEKVLEILKAKGAIERVSSK